MARREPSEASRRQTIHYARKAVRLMEAEALAPSRLGGSTIRLMVETAEGSAGERKHVFDELSRFLSWCRRQGLVEHNPCDALDRDERPKPGKARDHVPSLKILRAVWAAVEDEPMRDLVHSLLLVPLRRDEAAGLLWSEVDLDEGRVLIGADRMKNDEAHELPLAPQALAILAARKRANAKPGGLVFPSGEGKPFDGFNRLMTRIRKRIGQKDAPKDQAFTLHDIRRAFVSHLAGRFDVDLLDQCLSHTRKGVLGVYQRSSRMAERKAAISAWASLLLEEAKVASTSRSMAWRGSRARGVFRAPACIVFSSERPRLRSPIAAVRQALVRMLTWPIISAGKSKRPTFMAKAIAKYGRDYALPGFARALAACAG